MKNIIKKLKDLSQDHTRLTVLFLVIALFLVIYIVYGIANKYLNYTKTATEDFYVYLSGEKVSFSAEVMSNRKGVINSFKPNKDINFESLPIYSQDKIIMPNDMLIMVYENGNYFSYRTHAYSLIKEDEFVTKDYNNKIDHYFLYDTNNLYLFNDAGTLKVDDANFDLSPYSYVICTDDTVEYYDYDKDEYVVGTYKNSVIYDSHYYYVNLSADTIGRNGDLMPRSIEYLKFLK